MGEYNIGQFIYRSRKAIGLTQEELCCNENGERCFSVETLSRIECGKQRPNYRTMREIMRRLGKENCFCTPYLKTADYRVLELKRELKREITLRDYQRAENLLEEMEKQLSLDYMTNRQYLARTHALIDQRLGRITTEEGLEIMEEALQMTVHSYGTRLFSFEVLLPEEIVMVCNIANCYGKLGNPEKALELLQTVSNMLDDKTLQFNSYPSGLREMVNRNRIQWIGEQGKYQEAIQECDKAVADCLNRETLNTLPGLYYARAYNMQKLEEKGNGKRPSKEETLSDVMDMMDMISCMLGNFSDAERNPRKVADALEKMAHGLLQNEDNQSESRNRLPNTAGSWPDVTEKVKLDYIRCALLAELVHDEKGRDEALSRLKECSFVN